MWLSAHTWGLLTGWTPSPCRAFPTSRILGFAGLTDQTQHKGHSLGFSKLLGAFLLCHKSLKAKPEAPVWSISCLLRESRTAQLLPSSYSVLHHHRNLFAGGEIPTILSFNFSDKNITFPAHQVSLPALPIPVILDNHAARVVFHLWDAAAFGCTALISRANGPQMLCQYRHETNTAGCQFGLPAKRWNHHLC